MQNQLHFRKGKLSVPVIILLSVIGLIFLLLLAAGLWIGLLGLIPFAVLFGVREGVYLDLQQGKYCAYLTILGMGKREWLEIPEETRIGLRAMKLVANRAMGMRTLDSRETQVTLELFLYMPGPKRVVLETGNNFKAMHDKALMIHSCLGYEVVVDQRIEQMMNE